MEPDHIYVDGDNLRMAGHKNVKRVTYNNKLYT
jgi:hypothetical protein